MGNPFGTAFAPSLAQGVSEAGPGLVKGMGDALGMQGQMLQLEHAKAQMPYAYLHPVQGGYLQPKQGGGFEYIATDPAQAARNQLMDMYKRDPEGTGKLLSSPAGMYWRMMVPGAQGEYNYDKKMEAMLGQQQAMADRYRAEQEARAKADEARLGAQQGMYDSRFKNLEEQQKRDAARYEEQMTAARQAHDLERKILEERLRLEQERQAGRGNTHFAPITGLFQEAYPRVQAAVRAGQPPNPQDLFIVNQYFQSLQAPQFGSIPMGGGVYDRYGGNVAGPGGPPLAPQGFPVPQPAPPPAPPEPKGVLQKGWDYLFGGGGGEQQAPPPVAPGAQKAGQFNPPGTPGLTPQEVNLVNQYRQQKPHAGKDEVRAYLDRIRRGSQ